MRRREQLIRLLFQARQRNGWADFARHQVARLLAGLSQADLEAIALQANWPLDGLMQLIEPTSALSGKSSPQPGRA